MLKEKIKKVQALLRTQKVDALIIGNFGHQVRDDMMYYLLLEHLELGMMYIPARGKAVLWAIPFEVAELKERHSGIDVQAFEASAQHVLRKVIKTKKVVAVRPSSMPIEAHKELKKNKLLSVKEFKGKESVFAIKIDEEIAHLEKAAKYTDILFAELIDNWKTFSTEADAATFLLVKMAERGLEPSFTPIIASGAHAAKPHHSYTTEKLKKGFCVIDMGIRYKGYCSDMTRTVYIGKPTKAEKELYEKLREAQVETIALIAPGLRIQDLDTFCRKKIGNELNEQFIHALGHGLGTQVHEWPRVHAQINSKLQPGMYITIEPGIYKKGAYGIRIEDDVLVTPKGNRVLNTSTKALIEV